MWLTFSRVSTHGWYACTAAGMGHDLIDYLFDLCFTKYLGIFLVYDDSEHNGGRKVGRQETDDHSAFAARPSHVHKKRTDFRGC